MADVTSYALSLEFTLQDKASEVLKQISILATEVEQKIVKVQKSLSEIGGAGASAFKQINNQTTKTIAELGLIPDKIRQIEESISRVNATDFMEDDIETVGKAIDAARNLEVQYNSLLEAQHKLELQGKSASQQELNAIEKVSAGLENFRGKQFKLEGAIKKQSDKMGKDVGVNLKKESVGWMKRLFMSKAQKKEYGNLINLQLKQAKISGAPDAEVKRLTKTKNALGQFAEEGDPAQAKVGALSKGIGLLTSAMSGLGSMLTSVGLGAIVQATTLTGLFEVAIMGAAQRQELFHTANFRVIGSQEEIVKQTTAMRERYKVLAPEIDAATVALTEMGYKDQDIFDLAGANANFTRTTGASAAATARFSKMMKGATKDTTAVKNQLLIATRYSKEWGVAGKDNDVVLQEVAQSALFMGSSGGKSTEQYAQQLYKAAAAAKNLGIDVKVATDMVSKMKDPLKTVAFLGGESLKWDTTKRSQEMAKAAKEHLKMLEGAADEEERWVVRQQLLAMGYEGLGFSLENVDDGIKLMAESEKVAAKAGQKAMDAPSKTPLEEAQKNATEASNLLRESLVAVDKVLVELQAAASPILKLITEWIQWFNDNPAAAKWAAIGVAAVAALTAISAVLGPLISLIGMGGLGAALSTLAAGGLVMVGLVAVGGIIWAGYEAYKAWSQADESIKKTNETLAKTSKELEAANLQKKGLASDEDELARLRTEYKAFAAENERGGVKQFFGMSRFAAADSKKLHSYEEQIKAVQDRIHTQTDKEYAAAQVNNKDLVKDEAKKVDDFLKGRGTEVNAAGKAAAVEVSFQDSVAKAIEEKAQIEQKAADATKNNMTESEKQEASLEKEFTNKTQTFTDATAAFPEQLAALAKEREEVLNREANAASVVVPSVELEDELIDTERRGRGVRPELEGEFIDRAEGRGVRPETITTSKIEDSTARPIKSNELVEKTEKQTGELQTLNSAIARMIDKFDPKMMKDVLALLQEHLPKISEGRDSGLATPANQWIV